MKIAYINSSSGGIHSHSIYYDLLKEIKSRGHEITIIHPWEKREEKNTGIYFQNDFRYLGIRTGNLTKNPNLFDKAYASLRFDTQILNGIKDYLSQDDFDLVLYTTPPITINGIIDYFSKKGISTYLMLKDIFPQNAVDMKMFSKRGPIYYYYRKKEKLLYENSNHIGVMSKMNKDYLLKHNDLEHKVEILPNAIEVQNSPLVLTRKDFNLSETCTVLLYGGNLGIPQGVDFILECMDEVESLDDSKLLICGTGSEQDKIISKIHREGLKNTIYLGHLDIKKYTQLTLLVDIGLVFLDYRFTIPNYPQRVLSYMEAKLPIVLATDANTDVGSDAVNNNYGISVPSNDSKKWKNAILDLKTDPLRRIEMGKNGYSYLLENFNVKKAADTILKHFIDKN